MFGQLPRCFAGTLLLSLCFLLRPILKFRSVGASLMRFFWANISERRILVSNYSMACNSLCEFHTLDWLPHVCALPENTFRRRHVLKYATQLSCIRWLPFRRLLSQFLITPRILFSRSIVTLIYKKSSFLSIIIFQLSYCVFVIILFGPLSRLFINLTECIRALIPKYASILRLVELPFLEGVTFHKKSYCKFFSSETGILFLGFRVLDVFLSFCCMKEFGDGFDGVIFFTLIDIVSENAIVSCYTLSVDFPLSTSLILDHDVFFFIILISGQKSYFECFARYFFSPSFSVCDDQVLTFSDESSSHTIPIRSWLSQTLGFLIWTILSTCLQMGFASSTMEFHPILNRIPEYHHFEK